MKTSDPSATMNDSSWFANLACAFRLPEMQRPTIAYWMGAILFGGLVVLVAAWGNDSLARVLRKPSEAISLAVMMLAVSYLGALAFGIIAFLGNPAKKENFWVEQTPVAFIHWAAGLACCGLFLLAGLAIANMAEAPDIVGRIKAELDSGRMAFVIAMLLFSLRASWYCLTFSFPRLSLSQYAIFFIGFAVLFSHHGLHPDSPVKQPTELTSLLAWGLLCMDRVWKRIESRVRSGQVSSGPLTNFGMAAGNIATVGFMVFWLWDGADDPISATVWTVVMAAVLFGALVGLANLYSTSRS